MGCTYNKCNGKKILDLAISQQPDQNMSKSLLECDSYIKDKWIPAILTFLSVGIFAMAASSFAYIGCQKYEFSRPRRWDLMILISDSESPQNLNPENI